MTLSSPPVSLGILGVEEQFVHADLDLVYVDAVGSDLGRLLPLGKPVEVNYQPGDMTRYPLVFLPLASLATTRGRRVDGVEWDRRAVTGMGTNTGGSYSYSRDAYLVSYVDHGAVPLFLGNRAHDGLAAGYVGEKFNVPPVSAISLTLLLRSASWWIDHLRGSAGSV